MEITEFLTAKVLEQINRINKANEHGNLISSDVVKDIMEGAYERGLIPTLIEKEYIKKAIKYVEHTRPAIHGSTQAHYTERFLTALQEIKDGTFSLENKTTRNFAVKSGKLIKILLKDGLEVKTREEIEEKYLEGVKDYVGGGMLYHPELTKIVKEARSEEGEKNMLKEKLVNYLKPYLPRILDRTVMKHTHMHQSREETAKQKVAAEAIVAFERGGYPIVNGLIISKDN
jgi:hypothetical protein